MRHFAGPAVLGLLLAIAARLCAADALSELPEQWRSELVPIEEADVSGAERLMQQAMTESRQEVAELLTVPNPDKKVLARAYGRLGALALLLEPAPTTGANRAGGQLLRKDAQDRSRPCRRPLLSRANLDFNAGRYDRAAPGYAKAWAAEHEIAPARLLELVARLRDSEAEAEILERLTDLSAYERNELPQPAWPEGDPLFSPPPFDPVAPFRDYPAAVPY